MSSTRTENVLQEVNYRLKCNVFYATFSRKKHGDPGGRDRALRFIRLVKKKIV